MESRTKSTDTNLTNAPDGTTHTLTAPECTLRRTLGRMPKAIYRGAEYETLRYNPPTERWYLRPAKGPDKVVLGVDPILLTS